MTTSTNQPVYNGVNVAALLDARTALAETPEAAAFVWKAESTWIRGTHTTSKVGAFFGLGAEQARDTGGHEVSTDHPEQFAADDQAMTPVEMMLCGLAGCLTAGVATVAQHRDIQLHSVRATLEADMDLQGILGIDPDVRNGFNAVRVVFDIDADATTDELAALLAQSQKRSAVYDIMTSTTAVTVGLAT
ncbi:MAG: OsmC family protein [Acidimicrobiia bacterium]|nr:OsmC family protein [Acidimicrobiia bacterium]